MGTRTDCWFLAKGHSVGGARSRWCESRVWPSLGLRLGRLGTPCPGDRNPCRHCRQDLARRLVPSGRYKVIREVVYGNQVQVKRYSDGSVEFRSKRHTVKDVKVLWTAKTDCDGSDSIQDMLSGKVAFEVQNGGGITGNCGIDGGCEVRARLEKGKTEIKAGERILVSFEGKRIMRVDTRKYYLDLKGGPRNDTTNTVGLRRGLIAGWIINLVKWRLLTKTMRQWGESSKPPLLVKSTLVELKALRVKDMAEEVIGLMENLKFSEEELMDVSNNGEDMMETVEGSDKWVVGKLISPAMVDSGLLIRVFFTVWKDTPLEVASPLGPNMFLFKFKKLEDKEFVLNSCPWSFDGELLALKPFNGMLSPGEYNFYPLHIWVKIYQIPLGLMSQQTGERIGSTMGIHKAVDLREGDGRMGEYLRVRTEIDSSKLLRKFIALGKLADERLRMCPVKYERLPKFCFHCGRIGHGWEICPERPEAFHGPFQYGDWLRVDLGKNRLNLRKKPRIVYAGKAPEVKPKEGEGERMVGSQEEEEEEEVVETQTGKGKMISNTSSRLRSAKRSLKGKNEPSLMKQFRPIRLCIVVYKVCSKAIVIRLKAIMPVCIADNQSAFVPGRLITDNFLVAHELIHYLNSAKNGPNKGAAIKLDMEKAYDRVEWHFLHDILVKLGFSTSWIDIVMNCVTTVSYAIRVNGCISGTFRPTRGLRQGDPLSPYLLLFCTQGLSALLLKEQAHGRIVGVRASQRAQESTTCSMRTIAFSSSRTRRGKQGDFKRF
ncbi:hypothetical protein GQ457_18G011570 [Hibiscus cannabinus]